MQRPLYAIASLDVSFARLETRLRVDVFDITRSDLDLTTKTIHVSPLVRRQLRVLHVNWGD